MAEHMGGDVPGSRRLRARPPPAPAPALPQGPARTLRVRLPPLFVVLPAAAWAPN